MGNPILGHIIFGHFFSHILSHIGGIMSHFVASLERAYHNFYEETDIAVERRRFEKMVPMISENIAHSHNHHKFM